MNKINIALSALTLLAAASVSAIAAEPNGQPVNTAQLPTAVAASNGGTSAQEPDFLSLWANDGAISSQNADYIRSKLEQKGLRPGTFAYDQAASVEAFPGQDQN